MKLKGRERQHLVRKLPMEPWLKETLDGFSDA
jgi:hypothetical protein